MVDTTLDEYIPPQGTLPSVSVRQSAKAKAAKGRAGLLVKCISLEYRGCS